MTRLTSGISDLIERIKDEGVSAGESERERILEQARHEASQILAEAQKKAEALVQTAKDQSKAMKRETESEMRLAVRDFLAGFQKRIKDQLIRPLIDARLADTLADEAFLGNALIQIWQDYINSHSGSIQVTVSHELRDKLGAWLSARLAREMEKGAISLNSADGIKGFRLHRDGDGYVWDFTLPAISAELALLVEPSLRPWFDLKE